MADYKYWEDALAGKFGEVHDGDPQSGFYRKRTGKAKGYVPVAIWTDPDGTMIALVDGKMGSANEVWTYVCTHPVSEEHYRSRVETGKWWDEDESATESLSPPPVGHNAPPTDPLEILQGQIDSALKGVDEYAVVNDDETAAKAQSLRSRLLELSGDAEKKREALKRPHLDAGTAIDRSWNPLVKMAKAGADTIRAANSAFETRKLRAAEKAAAEAAEVRRLADLEAARLAAKALKAGKPAPAPPPPPPPPEPAPVASTTISGAYGRAASKKLIKKAHVVDYAAATAAMVTHPELKALVDKLAQRAVDAGMMVPGVTVEEVIDVR